MQYTIPNTCTIPNTRWGWRTNFSFTGMGGRGIARLHCPQKGFNQGCGVCIRTPESSVLSAAAA